MANSSDKPADDAADNIADNSADNSAGDPVSSPIGSADMTVHVGTARITAAIARMFTERGEACIREFTVKSGRRVDVISLAKGGEITVVEVKSSRQDFLSDRKWHEYPEWADRFYFAVDDSFDRDLLPGADICGIIITDGFDCFEAQPAPLAKLKPARRAHLTRRLAHVAMRRLEFGLAGAAGEGMAIPHPQEEDEAGISPA